MLATFQTLQGITAKDKEFCAFELHEEGLSFAHVSFETHDKPELKSCGFRHFDSLSQLESTLANIILEYNLKGLNCNFVLNPKYYRLLLVTTPSVSPDEYRSAVRWQIKEMIDYPIEDVVIDIFAPTGLKESESKKLYVIVAQSSFLQNIVNILERNQINTVAIDIHEFAIRNLITKIIPTEEPIVFLQIGNNESLLLIIEKEMVYFVRRIPIGFNNLQTNSNTADFPLEIQRSLDYYHSELRQTVPTKIILGPTPVDKMPILDITATTLAKDVQKLDVNKIVKYFEPLTPQLQERCYVAIGGALRTMGGK